ncbi:universal stress protein [Aurantimonas sp. A2-1-M11]|uniref:universal stress protein n=1 Tax=Aurantimonas sp. A2-1-M11 TaxID=3113712 RepID=UPI002F958462
MHKSLIADLAVYLDGSPADEVAIDYAETIASAFGAHLECLLANHIQITGVPAGPGSDMLIAELFKVGKDTGDATEAKLRERLERMAVPYGLRRSDGSFGHLSSTVEQLAGTTDIFVVPHHGGKYALHGQVIEAILFNARSAALVVPPSPKRSFSAPDVVVVGWRDSPECAHAVTAAVPFLKQASQVVLASVVEEGSDEQRHREPMADMARHLARHGVKVETRELPNWRHPADALMKEAESLGAEMIVVGAYGHSRLREMLLGGVTRELLTRCDVPLLMSR